MIDPGFTCRQHRRAHGPSGIVSACIALDTVVPSHNKNGSLNFVLGFSMPPVKGPFRFDLDHCMLRDDLIALHVPQGRINLVGFPNSTHLRQPL